MNAYKTANEWRAIIETARASGLSDRAWCIANNVPSSSFYYNVKRLRMQACGLPAHKTELLPSAPQQVVPVEIIDDTESHNELETNALTQPNNYSNKKQTALISRNFNGMTIDISDRASGDQIKAVLVALGEALC